MQTLTSINPVLLNPRMPEYFINHSWRCWHVRYLSWKTSCTTISSTSAARDTLKGPSTVGPFSSMSMKSTIVSVWPTGLAQTLCRNSADALLETSALELKAALEALFTLAQQRRKVHQGGAHHVLHLAGDRREQGGERAVQVVEDLLARLDQLGQGPHHLQGNPITTVPQSKLLLQGAPEP